MLICILSWGPSGCGLLPGEVLATRCGPGHHVGEAHLVLSGQHSVVHVVELLLSEAGQEQTLPWEKKNPGEPEVDRCSITFCWQLKDDLQKWFPGPGNHRPI